MVDRLVRIGDREADAEFVVPQDSPFVSEDGRLDETAYVEMIAQSLAAWHTFHLNKDEQRMHRGLLLAVNDLNISDQVRVGDQLQIHVRKLVRYGSFGVAQGTIRKQDGTVVATSEMKIWQSSDSPGEMVIQ
jgi:predicted hotdog family 3-hydroxylacyl-ACP dehydratase